MLDLVLINYSIGTFCTLLTLLLVWLWLRGNVDGLIGFVTLVITNWLLLGDAQNASLELMSKMTLSETALSITIIFVAWALTVWFVVATFKKVSDKVLDLMDTLNM